MVALYGTVVALLWHYSRTMGALWWHCIVNVIVKPRPVNSYHECKIGWEEVAKRNNWLCFTSVRLTPTGWAIKIILLSEKWRKLIDWKQKMKNWIIHLKIHFPSPIYIILFFCTNAIFLLWYASPTSPRHSHRCQCKCTSGAQVHRGGANFAPPLCNSTASDAFTRSSSWRLWNLVQPPWLAAVILVLPNQGSF